MYISIDLGGTTTRVASTSDLKNLAMIKKFETRDTLEGQKEILNETISDIAQNGDIQAICTGVAGLLNQESGSFDELPNVPYLNGVQFSDLFEGRFKRSHILAQNDAALAGLGEAVFGAGREFQTIAYLTISTGVGGARISNKKIDLTQKFFEPGHQVIVFDGREHDTTGIKGSLEAYVSGTAFEKIYGISPKECEDQTVWNDYAHKLSVGVLNIISMWAPDAIIVGGGLSNKLDSHIKAPLLKHLNEQSFLQVPTIKKVELGDESGIFGGFRYIEQMLSAGAIH